MRISIFNISYNQPGSYQDKKDSINGHGFHNFASFLVIGFAFRWVNYNEQKGEGNRKKVAFFVTFSLQPVPVSSNLKESREIRNLRL